MALCSCTLFRSPTNICVSRSSPASWNFRCFHVCRDACHVVKFCGSAAVAGLRVLSVWLLREIEARRARAQSVGRPVCALRPGWLFPPQNTMEHAALAAGLSSHICSLRSQVKMLAFLEKRPSGLPASPAAMQPCNALSVHSVIQVDGMHHGTASNADHPTIRRSARLHNAASGNTAKSKSPSLKWHCHKYIRPGFLPRFLSCSLPPSNTTTTSTFSLRLIITILSHSAR